MCTCTCNKDSFILQKRAKERQNMRQTKKVIEEELLVSKKLHKKRVLENTLSRLLLNLQTDF